MNAIEHVGFVLSNAVEKDEVSKAEMLRILRELITAAYTEGEGSPAMKRLSKKLGKRFEHVIHPDGITEGEDDGL